MTKQQGKKKTPVVLAVAFLVLALAAFAAAFYYFDGMSAIDSLMGTDVTADDSANTSDRTSQDSTSTGPAFTANEDGLMLPEGVSEEFALRMWQEQVDSQTNIDRLFDEKIEKVVITDVDQDEDVAVLKMRADFLDGTSADGIIRMEKHGEYWFFTYVTGLRQSSTGGLADTVASGEDVPPPTPLPDIEDVDVDVLNTIIAQQVDSEDILDAYAEGDIEEISFGEVTEGPGTKTLSVVMKTGDGEVAGDIVALSREMDGEQFWFIAKFTES